MKDIKDLTKALTDFRDERDWEQFHNSKDLALAISIEAAGAKITSIFSFFNLNEIENFAI